MTADFTFAAPDGVEIGCRVTGAGPALLCVHGTATDHLCFERIFPLLEGRFTLYQMDRRGRGMSGDGPDWSPEKEFADVAAAIDAIAAEASGPINVFGHSFGGLCCLEAASKTANIRRLVLYDPVMMGLAPHGDERDEIIAEMEAALEAGDPDRVIEVHFTRWLRRSPASVARRRRDKEAWARRVAIAPTMIREYTTPRVYKPDATRIEGISVPLRVLIGEESAEALQISTRWIKEHVPAAEVIELPGHGHYAFNGDPKMFTGLLTEFFEG